jgi:hypothetical protein
MEDAASFDWVRFRHSIHQAVRTLPHFLKNPVEGIRQLPDWDWPTLITLQAGFAGICGFVGGLAEKHVLSAIVSFFILPIVANAVNFIMSGFFYYVFLFFFHAHVDYRRTFTHLLFASIPVLIVSILSSFVPLVSLVGLGAACLLLIVGFSYNYGLPIKKVRNLLFGLFLTYAAILLVQMISWRGGKEKLRVRATPESLDILEKELKDDAN